MQTVVITAVGAVNARSMDWDSFGEADGSAPSFAPWPADAWSPGEGAIIGSLSGVDRGRYMSTMDQRAADKVTAMTVLAAGQALEAAGLWRDGATTVSGDEIATIIGTSRPEFGGFNKFGLPVISGNVGRINPVLFPYMARSVACGQVCITFKLRGYSTNMAAGPLSGVHAIARAWDLLRTGRCEVALAGGTECLSKASLRYSARRYAAASLTGAPSYFGGEAGKPVPAEGATVLVLETLESARRRSREPLARVTGAAIGRYRSGTEISEAAEAFARRTLPACGLSWEQVGVVSSGVAGTDRPSDQRETALLEWMADRRGHAPVVTACRSLTGDAEAASSVLQAAVAAAALSQGSVLPTANVSPRARLNVARGREAVRRDGALVTGFDGAGAYACLGLAAA